MFIIKILIFSSTIRVYRLRKHFNDIDTHKII